MTTTALLRVGVIGSVIAAACCATPVLVIVLGAVGLATWVVHVDAVLIPALGLFLALTMVTWWRSRREAACAASPPADDSRPGR